MTAGRSRLTDVIVAAIYAVLAIAVLQNQWQHLRTGYLRLSGQDQTMWEWFFAVTAKAVVHLDNPLSSDLQNAPYGVNMMANTAMLGLGIPLTPVTLTFGPAASFTAALTLGLATTAFGWYFLFSRTVVHSRTAAAVGGLIAGFAPGMISHANAHPNFVFLGVLPFLLYLLLRIAEGSATRRHVVGLGALVAWQILLGEEPLLILAVSTLLLLLAYTVIRPRVAVTMVGRSLLPVAIAAVIAGVLVAVPLWWQFRGPQSYSHLDHDLRGNDLVSFVEYPPQSWFGARFPREDLALNATEQNAYFGIGLVVLVLVAAVVLRRRPIAIAAFLTALALLVLSLGSTLMVGGSDTGIGMPGGVLDDVPLLQSILDTRFSMAAVPAMALLVAMATDVAAAVWSRRGKIVWTAALAVALVPLVPTPLPIADRGVTPPFLADGTWRDFVDADSPGSIVVVPLPNNGRADALRWQVETGSEFTVAGGYFVGPSEPDGGEGRYGPIDRPTGLLLGTVAATGIVPTLSEDQRATARADLAFWDADVVMVPPTENQDALRDTVGDLLGTPPTDIAGTYVWDVR